MIFKKLRINNITLNNRVVVGPMCQYSAINSCPSDWHFNHLQKLSQLGAGALWLESIFPSKKSSITKKDLVLSNNLELNQIRNLLKQIKQHSNVPLCFQISHAEKKDLAIFLGKNLIHLLNLKRFLANLCSFINQKIKFWPKPLELTLKKLWKLRSYYKFCKACK